MVTNFLPVDFLGGFSVFLISWFSKFSFAVLVSREMLYVFLGCSIKAGPKSTSWICANKATRTPCCSWRSHGLLRLWEHCSCSSVRSASTWIEASNDNRFWCSPWQWHMWCLLWRSRHLLPLNPPGLSDYHLTYLLLTYFTITMIVIFFSEFGVCS